MGLVERVALVTGGKRIGAVVAIELARRGADVAEETAAETRALDRRAAAPG